MPALTGRSSVVFVEPPAAPPPKAGATASAKESKFTDQFREARPIEPLATPVYPPRALKAKAGWATVGVKVTVDVNGRVSEVVPSMVAISTPGPFADDFLEAVRVALKQWRFRPARIEHVETVQSAQATYNRVASSENIEAQFDLSFTFTASGGVHQTPGK